MVFEMPMEPFILAANAFFQKSGTAGDSSTFWIIDRSRKFKTVQPHRKRLARHKQKRFGRKPAATKFLAKPITHSGRAIF